MLHDHLTACHMYLSSREILIRPLIPPTWAHSPFSSPRQRIYMSATLGAGETWSDSWGAGHFTSAHSRRMGPPGRRAAFLHFSRNVPQRESNCRTPSQVYAAIGLQLGFGAAREKSGRKLRTTSAKTCNSRRSAPRTSRNPKSRSSKSPKQSHSSRADTTDHFPGAGMPVLFIEGLPKAINLQERFLMSRMGANLLFNDRIQNAFSRPSGGARGHWKTSQRLWYQGTSRPITWLT